MRKYDYNIKLIVPTSLYLFEILTLSLTSKENIILFCPFERTVARSHRNAPRVRRAHDARQASLATVGTVC